MQKAYPLCSLFKESDEKLQPILKITSFDNARKLIEFLSQLEKQDIKIHETAKEIGCK